MDMNDDLQNGCVSSGIGLINSHTLPQCNKWSNSTEINWGVKNINISGGHSYTNSHTPSEAKNHSSVYSKKKSDENTPNRFEI